MKYFKLLLVPILFITLLTGKIYASSSSYSANYNILYNISRDGETNVTYNISLTNLTSTEYASSYSLSVPNTDITNLSVTDSYGNPLNYTENVSKGITTIVTNFSSVVYGYGTSQNWVISYKTNQIALIHGKLTNIVIPGFVNNPIYGNITTTIDVPDTLGKVNFSSPTNPQITQENGYYSLFYNSSQSYTPLGILLSIGNYQNYNFKFSYKLANTGIFNTQIFKIVIPADFSTQEVTFSKIQPTPTKTYIDGDGNYILEYLLSPRQTENVSIDGEAQVYSTYGQLNNPLPQKLSLSPQEVNILTSTQPYWQVSNPTIKTLAQKIIKGDTTVLQKAQSINNYVSSTLKYNDKAILDPTRQRLGALKALSEPDNAICQEYADLFVTLARADGIPARMLAGYGDPPTVNVNPLPSNILHAWAQFFDPSYGWVSVDPTWQSTSGGLDFFGNVGSTHFIIARYGESSINPPLILSFVKEKNPQNNIDIEATSNSFNPNPNFTPSVTNAPNLISGITNELKLRIDNTGNQVLRGVSISINSQNKNLQIGKIDLSNEAIFPGESEYVYIPIKMGSFFANGSETVQINVSFESYQKQVVTKHVMTLLTFKQIFLSGIVPWVLVLILIIISIIIADIILKLKVGENKRQWTENNYYRIKNKKAPPTNSTQE